MKRTIKFKARRIDGEKWAYGYFYEENDNSYIIENRQEESMLSRNPCYQVDPDTVCQFTGLYDGLGREIYEGDVLRSNRIPFSYIKGETSTKDDQYAVVIWLEERGIFIIETHKKIDLPLFGVGSLSWGALQDFVIVGNINESEWQQFFLKKRIVL